MNETSSTYRSPWLVKFTDGAPPEDLDDGLHWFPVGPTGDGRVMWRRPAVAVAAPERHKGAERATMTELLKQVAELQRELARVRRRERADDDPRA